MAELQSGIAQDLDQQNDHLAQEHQGDRSSSVFAVSGKTIKEILNIPKQNEQQQNKSVLRLSLELNVSIRLTRVLLLFEAGRTDLARDVLFKAEYVADAVEDELLKARCSIWAGVLHAKDGDDDKAAESFLNAIHIVDQEFPESRLFFQVLHDFRVAIERWVNSVSDNEENTNEILRIFHGILDEDGAPLIHGDSPTYSTLGHDGYDLRRLNSHGRSWLQSQRNTQNPPIESDAQAQQRQSRNSSNSNRQPDTPSTSTASRGSGFMGIDAFLTKFREPEKHARSLRRMKMRRVGPLVDHQNNSSLENVAGHSVLASDVGQDTSRTLVTGTGDGDDARLRQTLNDSTSVGSQRGWNTGPVQNREQDQAGDQQFPAPGDVGLSDTLALEELDRRVETATGRRRSIGADLPATMGITTSNAGTPLNTDMHSLPSPRLRTEPAFPSPLRRASLPGSM